MPKGEDTSNHPSRRPKIIDLEHFRKTREIKDVRELEREKNQEQSAQFYDQDKDPKNTDEYWEALEAQRPVSEDTDPTPYQGIPRPEQPKDTNDD